jgi:Phage integrase, N-terminal SAM-like domain
MKLALGHRCAAACPYRLLDDADHEIAWANDFLDAQHLRQLSPRSLRAYAYDLLHFARWFQSRPQALSEITESTLLDYVRHQLSQQPRPTPQTVNHRLTVIGAHTDSITGKRSLPIPISNANGPHFALSAMAALIAPSPSDSASDNPAA